MVLLTAVFLRFAKGNGHFGGVSRWSEAGLSLGKDPLRSRFEMVPKFRLIVTFLFVNVDHVGISKVRWYDFIGRAFDQELLLLLDQTPS